MKVNGRTMRDPDARVDPGRDAFLVDGAPVRRTAFRCVMLHKPCGIVTTRRDERGRRTVFDLLGSAGEGLKVVGRLDLDSSGMLLLTSDSRLADALTAPESGVEKVYEVLTDVPLGPEALKAFEEGMDVPLPGRMYRTRPAPVESLGGCRYRIVLTEGKNRQLRRMIEASGARVAALHRVSVGGLALGPLGPGAWRDLTPAERTSLRTLGGVRRGRGGA